MLFRGCLIFIVVMIALVIYVIGLGFFSHTMARYVPGAQAILDYDDCIDVGGSWQDYGECVDPYPNSYSGKYRSMNALRCWEEAGTFDEKYRRCWARYPKLKKS